MIQPIKTENRIFYLDILRGIAIFFIFSANIVYFSGYFDFPKEARLTSTLFIFDDYLDFILYALVDGKFYSIFSLLFGIGCAIQYHNLTKNNKPFAPFFRRRMSWLLVFGLIHLLLFWAGDILTLYALLGFVLIGFVNFSNKKLLYFAGILILLPILNWVIIYILGWNYPSFFFYLNGRYFEYFNLPVLEFDGLKMTDFKAWLLNESLLDFFKMNIGNSLIRIGGILDEGRIFKVLGIFLIGLWAGRKIIHENLLENTNFLKKAAFWGFCIGLPISLFRAYIHFYIDKSAIWELTYTISYAFGTVPLALGYAALLALIYKKMPFLFGFAFVGKMALSNYLFQTALATIIFYGIGFGFAGKLGFSVIFAMAVVIYSAQVLLSIWWLKHHKFGPMEWLWRQLTYRTLTNKNNG
ncbi:MAG: DUF418 domain-containing protein [Flavobacteriales bacterium]|nr:DUF418 domain-containing protein [Flavobacteriia bacterium]NCP06706.1 DUF418 domain-containing protein [Flavobacteriales bacterium]PIV92768.1 MAG: hypothetical protein COW44_13010 [Flavobacteriaceae bacterium CG17_big_fil_post_rev_8_21_14_2_50_33_15]PIY11239.1 MAG: hypothetical protein COZ17_07335 [Flavobacteriaceae bacterium CG_4_10_14_3_um_filter_33_47]PJB18508.1 MAG: hypothetical protein CO117_07890 [Flavobacteriaceae bacterium CG_4_9_14_3_um_filter_33_16]